MSNKPQAAHNDHCESNSGSIMCSSQLKNLDKKENKNILRTRWATRCWRQEEDDAFSLNSALVSQTWEIFDSLAAKCSANVSSGGLAVWCWADLVQLELGAFSIKQGRFCNLVLFRLYMLSFQRLCFSSGETQHTVPGAHDAAVVLQLYGGLSLQPM